MADNNLEEIELLPPCPPENIIYINNNFQNKLHIVIITLLIVILFLTIVLVLIMVVAHKAHVEIILENLKEPFFNFKANSTF